MTYLVIRYGSNSANQSMRPRLVLGTVEIEGHTTAQRKRALQERIGQSLPGTLHATTTFRQDNGEHWHAYSNQYFRLVAWAKASADDKAAVTEEEYASPLA